MATRSIRIQASAWILVALSSLGCADEASESESASAGTSASPPGAGAEAAGTTAADGGAGGAGGCAGGQSPVDEAGAGAAGMTSLMPDAGKDDPRGDGTGACDNGPDQAVLEKEDFDATVDTCGNNCVVLGGTDCVTDCVVMETGVSEECARCYDSLVNCSAQGCWDMCIFEPDGETCRGCVAEMCEPNFHSCRGYGDE